jgi:hypothetical protein
MVPVSVMCFTTGRKPDDAVLANKVSAMDQVHAARVTRPVAQDN